jgi:hypothetical protein
MSDFPDSPRVLKGAIISVGVTNPVPTIIAFQYNPDTLSRTLEPRTVKSQDGAGRAEAMRLAGAPKESLSCSIELDGTENSPLGVAPQISTLELLLYPPSAVTIAKAVMAVTGIITVIDPPAPLTLFAFGPYRVVPVRLSNMTITEEAFNPQLTPIRAKVDLKMDVLSTYDLPIASVGYALALAHQVAGIEALGRLNTLASLGDLGVSLNL